MTSAARSVPVNAQRIREDRARAEMWFGRHLWENTGVDIFAGDTTISERVKRICSLLTEKGLIDQVLGRFNGKPETYKQFVKRALDIDVDAQPQERLL